VHYDIELNSAAIIPFAASWICRPPSNRRASAPWKGESNSTDPLVLLSAIAARTSKLKLGTAIYHIYGRSAVTLGIQSATIQDLSGGRLLLGLGRRQQDHRRLAQWRLRPPLRRAANISTSCEDRSRERVEYEGEIYNTGKRFQLSCSPIIELSHLSRRSRAADDKLVGKISDGVFINMGTPATIKDIASRVREGGCRGGPRSGFDRDHRQGARFLESRRAMARSKLPPGPHLLQHRRSL